ncbi:hypothetical protein STENM327S_01055 [Streptomyces tendae]
MSTTAPMSTTAVAPLTIQDAEDLVTAAHRAAEAADVTVSVTVLDAGGHLLAFRRDDRAVLISGETSTRKAYTALQPNAPTADLVDAVQPGGPFHTLPTALDRPLLFIAGGRVPRLRCAGSGSPDRSARSGRRCARAGAHRRSPAARLS